MISGFVSITVVILVLVLIMSVTDTKPHTGIQKELYTKLTQQAVYFYKLAQQDANPLIGLIHRSAALSKLNTLSLMLNDDDLVRYTQIDFQAFKRLLETQLHTNLQVACNRCKLEQLSTTIDLDF